MKASCLLAVFFTLVSYAATRAQTSCSTVAAGNWNTNTIWSCGTYPSGTYSGSIVISHNVIINTPISISGLTKVTLRNNATIDVRGNNSLTLWDNSSIIDVLAGSSVGGQNANSTIIIGTGANSFTYRLNGSAIFRGPDVMTSRGLSSSLPVELLFFNARADGQRVSLSWAAASEQNALQYVVERSRDLGEFTPVGRLDAAGTAQVRRQYGLLDEQPLLGVSYYRLRQIDRDGRFTVSRPVAVSVEAGAVGLHVLGNPVQDGVIRLLLQGDVEQPVGFQLITEQGQTYSLTSSAPYINGSVALPLPAEVSPGTYLLLMRHPAGQLTRRLCIE